jgi:hypothetical protein
MNLQTLNNTPPWDWPENVGDFIFNALCEKNTPVSDRVLAAELAGDRGNSRGCRRCFGNGSIIDR